MCFAKGRGGALRAAVLALGLVACAPALRAQGHDWWANNVGWDGKSHWSTYIISQPRYLGPNALPIPSLPNGLLEEQGFLALDAFSHSANGDQTFNPHLTAYVLPAPGKVAMELQWIPVEYFVMSHAVKTERKVFHLSYDSRWATGDVLLHTYVQVLRHPQAPADALLRIGYRFPSSSMLGAARFTDAPGYFFDLSAGKPLARNWRLYGMLGFYVWQTNRDDRLQNDAFLFGAGLSHTASSWEWKASFRGYWGYMGSGDDPMAVSLSLQRRSSHRASWRLGVQQGLLDLRYSTLFVGVVF